MAAALAAGLAAAVLGTYPLVTRLADSVVHCALQAEDRPCRDNLLDVWILGDVGRRLYEDPLRVFEAGVFHPLRHTLAYSESMLSAGALMAPLNAYTGNPVLGYNVYYLATYVLSVLGVFLLVREATGDARAALVAGWLFGLADDRWWAAGHLPAISVQWVPFVLWAWLRVLDRPGAGRVATLALLVLAHEHASAYHALVLPLLLVPWAAVLLAGPWPRRRWLLAAAVAGGTYAVGLVAYLPYAVLHTEIPYRPEPLHTVSDLRRYWLGLFDLRAALHAPFAMPRTRPNASALPLVALAAAAMASALRRPRVARPAGEAAAFGAAIVFWLGACVISVDPLLPGVPGPFVALRALPGFSSMRSPARFGILASLGGAVVLGLALAAVLRRVRGRAAAAMVVIVAAVLVVVDTRVLLEPMVLERIGTPDEVPRVYRALADSAPDTVVLELPNEIDDEPLYMVYALFHHRRIANGYSALMPRLFRIAGRFPDEATERTLAEGGVDYVLVHRDRLLERGRGALLLDRLDAHPELVRARYGATMVVEVPPVAARPLPPSRLLARRGWRVTASAPGAARAADGDLATHWTPAPGRRESWLRVDLGRVQQVVGVTLRLGPHLLEYPRSYQVWASEDGETWTEAGGEERAVPPLASYRRDHRDVAMRLVTTAVRARHLEIRVPANPGPHRLWGTTPLPNWGVHEVEVHAGAGLEVAPPTP